MHQWPHEVVRLPGLLRLNNTAWNLNPSCSVQYKVLVGWFSFVSCLDCAFCEGAYRGPITAIEYTGSCDESPITRCENPSSNQNKDRKQDSNAKQESRMSSGESP